MEKKIKKSVYFLVIAIALLGILISACSGGASASIVGEWRLVSYGPASGLKPAAPGVETLINFGSDGRMNGNVGCNSFGGDYEVSGAQIKFGSLLSTLMACEGTIGAQESAVLAVFVDTVNFKLTGATLTITSADGNSAVVLAKK